MKTRQHPDVLRHQRRPRHLPLVRPMSAEELRQLCLDAGADDVGLVALGREELDDQREHMLAALPTAKAVISFVKTMNRAPIRSPARSVANLEFHHTGDEVNEVGRRIVAALQARGVDALNPAMGFPMEMDRFPGRSWVIAHKPVAVAAGLGVMGIHRNVIHPRFGNFILLGSILVDLEVAGEGAPLDYNPCLECKLCVAACPVGAIKPDGHFDFSACYTHNYREFMSGFSDWVETIADASDAHAYRERVTLPETVSMWQSLSFGASYKAAYCLAVCPAGQDVIGPFLDERKSFVREIVRPLQQKEETVYVVPGSDAEAHVAKRFPHKTAKRVRSGLRPLSIAGFLDGLPLLFQRAQAEDLDATFHFTFEGDDETTATVVIRESTLSVTRGHSGEPDVHVSADAATWLRYLAGEASIVWAVMRRKVRVAGPLALLKRFEACFPT